MFWKISTWNTGKNRKVSNKAIFALVFYLILPVIALNYIMVSIPELSDARLIAIMTRIIPIGILLVLISQFGVKYERGSLKRFVLSEVYVVLVLLWLFALLGGELVIHQAWEEYQFSLHIWKYLALILFVTALNVAYYMVEYKAYGKQDRTGGGKIEQEKAEEDTASHKSVTITTFQSP